MHGIGVRGLTYNLGGGVTGGRKAVGVEVGVFGGTSEHHLEGNLS